jgi:hypothetical protein
MATKNISENVMKGLNNLASGVLRNYVNQSKVAKRFSELYWKCVLFHWTLSVHEYLFIFLVCFLQLSF